MIKSSTALVAAALVLTSCCTTQKSKEDAEVAKRCSPVKDLLSKNYRRNGKLDLLVVNAGGLVERTGAVLSGEEAKAVSLADALCRAWVFGAINNQQYAAGIMALASATVVETTSEADRPAVVASMTTILKDFKLDKILPPELDPTSLAVQVRTDAALSPDARIQGLRSTLDNTGLNLDSFISIETQNQVDLIRRLESLDARLARLEPVQSGSGGQTPGAGPAQLEIYFSTGNSEVTYDGRQRLRDAASGWKQPGISVSVLGYADPRGSLPTNMRLSQARADAVAAILRRLGVTVRDAKGGGIGSGHDDDDLLRFVRIVRNGS